MSSSKPKTVKPTTTKGSDQWVRELSSGIGDGLRRGEVAAVLLDLTFPDGGGMETLDKPFQSACRVPI